MGTFGGRLRTLALGLGAPGLFLVAFLDSSFLSLPELADFLVIYMIAQHKHRVILYVVAATTGSLTGCLVMFYVGLKGGEALLRRRFATARVDSAMNAIRRHGMMAVLVPSMLPPPMPFKIFVLLAGVVGITPVRFAAAGVIGRGLRFSLLGFLAVEYGDRALTYMRDNALLISGAALGLLVGGFMVYLWVTKGQSGKSR